MSFAAVAQIPPPAPPEALGWTAEAVPNGTPLTATLYVGDLHPEATESDVIEAFRSVGPVVSVKLCRDKVTHKSLRYAYVNFFSHPDAAKAMACLNHSDLRGRPMRIMWSQRDPLTRKTGIGNLYVKNLHPSLTSARLEELFSKYGAIRSCKVAEENGNSKGFGFIQFDSEDSAISALNALNGTLLEGRSLYVTKFMKKTERKGTSGEETFTNLYVKNLDHSVTENLLAEMFSEHGKVRSAVIMKNDEGKSRGFGFVQLDSHQEAIKAMEALNGAQIGCKTLFVGRAQRKAERQEILKGAHSVTSNHYWKKDSNLYVKNLDLSIGHKELKEIFSAHGKVTSAKVMCHGNGASKGFGFVSFSSLDEAKKALVSLNGANVRGLSLYVALAQHRGERSGQLSYDYAHYQPQFYPPSWDIFTSRCYTPQYNFLPWPQLAVPYWSSQEPAMHQNFGRPVGALYPSEVQKYWGNQCRPWQVLLKGSDQGTTKDVSFQHNPMKFNCNLNAPVYEQNSQTLKDKRTYIKWEVKNSNGAAIASSSGSICTAASSSSSSWMHKTNFGKVLHPLVENIQPGKKFTGMLLEMGKSDLQNLKNCPQFVGQQVEKTVHMLNAANSWSSSTGVALPEKKSVSSLHL